MYKQIWDLKIFKNNDTVTIITINFVKYSSTRFSNSLAE